MKILLVGGPKMNWGRWYDCKPDSKTFTIDIPEMKVKGNPFSGMWMVRYLYHVRAIEGCDFLVGDFDWKGWK